MLEAGFSARPAGDLGRTLGSPPLASMPAEYLTPAAEYRAVHVQRLLAERGQHRAPSIPDVLIAAVAELNQRTVLHLDKEFDLVADLTSQPIPSPATCAQHAARGPTRAAERRGRAFGLGRRGTQRVLADIRTRNGVRRSLRRA